MSTIIGIDLGTTNTCASVLRNGKVEMIPNAYGEVLKPSVVFYGEGQVEVGQKAIDMLTNFHNKVYVVKRLMGKLFDDEKVQDSLKDYMFTVVKGNNGKAAVQIRHANGAVSLKSPEEVSAEILRAIKEESSKHLGRNPSEAVITVPAHFTNAQRLATEDAARIAGFQQVRLINEPSAAAICFAVTTKPTKEHFALVYDLGGGTLDVSVVRFTIDSMQVAAIMGDTHLGGYDFDRNLVQHLIGKTGSSCDKVQLRRLFSVAERAKIELSSKETAEIKLDAFYHDRDKDDLELEVTRGEFEAINRDLVERSVDIVDRCITESRVLKEDIDEVLLVGGSTRVPLVQKALRDFFGGKQLNTSIDPDKAVAIGAAIQAAIFSDDPRQTVDGFTVNEVVGCSLGIETQGCVMSFLIRRNAPVPVTASRSYPTTYENQRRMLISVYEGESASTEDNSFLGKLSVDDISPGPAGSRSVRITFSVNENGILQITASEGAGGRSNRLQVAFNTGKLTEAEIRDMLVGARSEFVSPESTEDCDIVEDDLN